MAFSGGAVQQRIVRQLVRRNVQGWGRPLAFTEQRLRLGGYLGLAGLVALAISLNIFRHSSGFLSTLLEVSAIFLLLLAAGIGWYALPAFLRARYQPTEQITGTVDAAICDVSAVLRFAPASYHFITVRLPTGKLRPFAIDPALHAQTCTTGKRLTLTVTPGIDHVDAVS